MKLQRYQPDLADVIRKAHDIRKIEPCECGGIGFRPHMIRIDGKWWHGRCAVAEHGVEKIAGMGKQAYAGLRWNEIGTEAMRYLVHNSN